MRRMLGLALLLLAGCAEEEVPACDASLDADQDGIDDCMEEDLGLNPAAADSDADGFTDAEEIDCVSDPLDPDEACYDCGWEHNDPGTLVSNGAEIGDVMDGIRLHDQCGERVALWDFYAEYHILWLTAAW